MGINKCWTPAIPTRPAGGSTPALYIHTEHQAINRREKNKVFGKFASHILLSFFYYLFPFFLFLQAFDTWTGWPVLVTKEYVPGNAYK